MAGAEIPGPADEEAQMELEEAVRIVAGLRDGSDVLAERDLPADSVCQAPHVVRALFTVLQFVESVRAGPVPAGAGGEPQRPRPVRAGARWDPEEDERLLAGFDEGRSQAELARQLGRSRNAVRARLVLLGRLDPQEAPSGLRSPVRPRAEEVGVG